MKVLVLGGTGAMGRHLVELLNKNDFEVFVTSRSYRVSHSNVNYLLGDAKDLTFIKKILSKKWDAIVDFMVYSTALFEERVEILLNATSQYVFLSSARVYANSETPIAESSSRLLDSCYDTHYLSTDEYALTKARQEDILKNSSRSNWTIIRPYITYGEERLQLGVLEKEDWLYRALMGRTIVFSKDIATKLTTLTYGLDVSKGIEAIIGKYKALGEVLHITCKGSKTWHEVLDIYLCVLEKHLGYRPKVILQDLDGFLQHYPYRAQVVYDRLYNRTFDNSKIHKFTNTLNFLEINEGLSVCLEKFIENPIFKKIDLRREAQKDIVSKEFMSFNEIDTFKNKLRYIMYRYLKKYKY
jgi:nucleoside-diphosphate-sugar epimerase